MNCKYCQRPVGEVTDCDGGKHGWTHDHQAGPDSFDYCGDEFGTYATPESPLIDGLIKTVMVVERRQPTAAEMISFLYPNHNFEYDHDSEQL
jgi:hypothetical protein